MIDGRFDQHFIELFAGSEEDRPPAPAQDSAVGPLFLATMLAGLALLATLPFLA